MRKFLAAATIALFALLGSSMAFAQSYPSSEASRKAELDASWQAAGKAGTSGPSDVVLIDQAALKLPKNYFFVPRTEGARILRALGNVVDETDEGMMSTQI